MNPILAAFISQLRQRDLDIEYRGEEDRIYLIGNAANIDEPTKRGVQAAKRKLLKEILVPAFEKSDGQPVRLHSANIPSKKDELCPKCGATACLGNGITREDVARCCRADRGEMNCPYERSGS